MSTFNIILIIIAILAFYFLFYSIVRKKNTLMDFTFEHTNFLSWSEEELSLLNKLNEYRLSEKLNMVLRDDDMILLAQGRTQYLIDNNITKELHTNFFKHRQPYLDIGLESISENATYAYRNVFRAMKGSQDHNYNMLKEDWLYIGISIQNNSLGKKYVSLILAK